MKSLEDMTEPELREVMTGVAKATKGALPPQTAFIVLASGHEGAAAQYVSNVEKGCAAAWMIETIERWEKGDFVPRSSEVEEKRHAHITALMDQESAAARDFGKKVDVTEIEVLALANLAKYGLYHALVELGASLDQEARAKASALLEEIKGLDSESAQPGKTPRIVAVCAAILSSGRLGKYVLEDHDE